MPTRPARWPARRRGTSRSAGAAAGALLPSGLREAGDGHGLVVELRKAPDHDRRYLSVGVEAGYRGPAAEDLGRRSDLLFEPFPEDGPSPAAAHQDRELGFER